MNYFDADYLHNRTGRPLTVLGRLKPGVTPQQATENLSAIAAALAKEYPQTDTGLPLRLVRPGLCGDTGDVIRGFLYSVTGLALLVLGAACANLASLFAARAADRSRELALRVALGASRWRVMRQLITEAMVVSMLGGAAGLVIAGLLLGVLNQWQSPHGHLAVSVDARVYLAALTLTLLSALLFGMIPARQVWQSSPLQAMKSGPVDSTPLRRLALRDLLLGAQIAICTLLVTASLVAVRGMVRMLHVPLGFQPQGAMLAEMDLSETGRRRAAREKESDDRGGAKHPWCDGGGNGEQSALYRRAARCSGFPAGDNRVHAEQFCAGAVPVYDIAGLPGGCRHPAPGVAGISHGMTPQRRRMW